MDKQTLLKKGDIRYRISAGGLSVRRLTYLCVHPTASNYHLFMDTSLSEAVRLYKDDVLKLHTDRVEAQKAVINEIKRRLEFEERTLNEIQETKHQDNG